MKFLVKPIKDKFEGYCFGSSHAMQKCGSYVGCTADYSINFPDM